MPKSPEKFRPKFEAEREEEMEEPSEISKEGEPEEKEKIQSLEKLPLGSQDRMNLILTYLGEKPASTVEIEYFAKKPLETVEEIIKEKEGLEQTLNEVGLEFKMLETEKTDENGFDEKEFKFLVAENRENLDELEKATLEGDDKKIGSLFGFPETAIEAFDKGKREERLAETMLDEGEWWKKLSSKEKKAFLEEKVLNFLNFKLSKEHWEEELGQVRKWQKTLEKEAPELYQEILSKKPEAIMTKDERKRYEKKEAEKELEAIREKVEKIQDALGKPIEKGIKETVVLLNAFDIRTKQSCEGHFEKERKTAPWVLIYPREPRVEKWTENKELRERVRKQSLAMRGELINLLTKFYEERKVSFDATLGFSDVGYGFKLQSTGAKILPSLSKEKQGKKFPAYKKEMQEFTKFLKKNYADYAFGRLR